MDLKNDLPIFIYPYKRVKKRGLDKQGIAVVVRTQQQLRFII
jgi:hypothetical protein